MLNFDYKTRFYCVAHFHFIVIIMLTLHCSIDGNLTKGAGLA